MAYPVKTLILQSIKQELQNILQEDDETPFFTQVIRNPSKPIDHDYFKSPMCFIFDEDESVTRRNRLADCVMPIQIEAWMKFPDKAAVGKTQDEIISDMMDIMQAEVHKAIVNSTLIRVNAKDIQPDQGANATKFFIDEFFGGIALRYQVKYLHVWEDPYDVGRQ